MARNCWLVLMAIASSSIANATTYTVRYNRDSGLSSLRWALTSASNHAGRDNIVFAPMMAGKVIRPLTELPRIDDNRTIINGDIDGDGAPDVVLNGKHLSGPENGLWIWANRCTVAGLAIIGFPQYGILVVNGDRNNVRSCHLGVNLAGTKSVHNAWGDLRFSESDDNTIGGTRARDRNIISGGIGSTGQGLLIYNGAGNVVVGNHFGLDRAGMTPTGAGRRAIVITYGSGNLVGGATPGERNVFGGVDHGIAAYETDDNVIAGNYFGLARDGNTQVPLRYGGVAFYSASTGNTVGGTVPEARNVFAGGAPTAVYFGDAGTRDNRVRGNYFGTNAAGTRQRRLGTGVWLWAGCGPQIIGGATSAHGNYFALRHRFSTWGVRIEGAGSGTIIRHNTFGVRPAGGDASGFNVAVECSGATNVRITDNLVARTRGSGIRGYTGANLKVFRNTFRHCYAAVWLFDDAICRLGNLNNVRTADDGGNVFRASNTWFIRNQTPNRVRAEGNSFGTTSRATIDAKIQDKLDNASYGRVDFAPLMGGVSPTGDIESALTLTSLAAVSTSAGAQITFTLSSSGSLSARILNIAGRPIKTLCRARECEAGTNTLLWNARSDAGLAVPSGTYLIEVNATSPEGSQARALARFRLNR